MAPYIVITIAAGDKFDVALPLALQWIPNSVNYRTAATSA